MIPFSRPANWLYVKGTCHELGHTWHPSCTYCTAEIFAVVFWSAAKIYFPLYLISDVLRGKHLKSFLLHTVPHILRSSLFLAVNGGSFIFFICLLRRLIGQFYFYTAAFLPALLASITAILCERKSRRGLLTGYVGTLAVEVLYCMLKHRGYISPVRHGEPPIEVQIANFQPPLEHVLSTTGDNKLIKVLLFSFATAVLMHSFRSKAGLQDAIGAFLRLLFKPRLPAGLHRPSSLRNGLADMALSVALVSGWSFLVGYILQTLISLIGADSKSLTHRGRLKKALLRPYNAKFGVFLASLTGGFKVLNTLLFTLPIPRDTRLVVAGMLAGGLSMCCVKSSAISLYAAGKALEVLYFKAVERGWLKKWYYGDVLLYAFSCAILFHAAFFEAHNLRLSYWNFLTRCTLGRLEQINYDALDKFGTQASTRIREQRERKKKD